MRLTLDASVRRYDHGRVLLGGSPLRLLRLGKAAAGRLDSWLAGAPLGEDARDGLLARRLLDAGVVHPTGGIGCLTTRDVTLVVPVKDDATGVAAVLAATTDLAARIVVDDGSTAPLLHATVRHLAPRGPAAARNTGMRQARTELVAFVDSDAVPEPGWLEAVLPLFDDPQVAAVAPRIRSAALVSAYQRSNPDRRSRAIARYESGRSSLDMGSRPAAVRPMSRVSYVPSAALVVRRSVLSTLDGFDERLRFGEDVDLVWRIIAAGWTVRYQPESTVRHEPRPTLRAWLRQRFDYGTSAAPLSARHPGRLSCALVSPAGAAPWVLAATGHPLAALAVGAVTTGTLCRRLRTKGVPTSACLVLAGNGQLATARGLSEAARRAWWPLALLTPHGRVLLLAAFLPSIVEAAANGHGFRWTALRIADDLAYGAGVWAGGIRHRTTAPLLPRFTGWPRRSR